MNVLTGHVDHLGQPLPLWARLPGEGPMLSPAQELAGVTVAVGSLPVADGRVSEPARMGVIVGWNQAQTPMADTSWIGADTAHALGLMLQRAAATAARIQAWHDDLRARAKAKAAEA